MQSQELKQVHQFGNRFRHKKSGGRYRVVAAGRIESDLTECVVYESESTGLVWVRSKAEFNDGRFECIDNEK